MAITKQIQNIEIGDEFQTLPKDGNTYEKHFYCRDNKSFKCVNIEDQNLIIYVPKFTIVKPLI